MRLLNGQTGVLTRGRCKSPNLCDYCAKLAAVENSELLALDALWGEAPAIWAVLTTPRTIHDPKHFYEHRRQLQKALKRRWPSCEYVALLEFTTGYGPRSGGKRRPHWNLLLKGIPVEAVDQVHDVVANVWCPRVGGKPEAQHVGEISEAGGLMRYIALHFQKESQQPPKGWRGQRILKSQGYLWTSTPVAREAAREALSYKRAVWRIEQALPEGHPFDAAEIDEFARTSLALRATIAWRLVHVDQPREASGNVADRLLYVESEFGPQAVIPGAA